MMTPLFPIPKFRTSQVSNIKIEVTTKIFKSFHLITYKVHKISFSSSISFEYRYKVSI